jgi:hypothetical protein
MVDKTLPYMGMVLQIQTLLSMLQVKPVSSLSSNPNPFPAKSNQQLLHLHLMFLKLDPMELVLSSTMSLQVAQPLTGTTGLMKTTRRNS